MKEREFVTENIAEADWALTEKPLLATSAERFLILNELSGRYAELAQPLRFSKLLSILLSRVSTPIEDYDQIAGRCVDRVLSEAEEKAFQNFLTNGAYQSIRSILLSSGHCTYSWELVVKEGLSGLRRIAKQRLRDAEDEDKKIFMRAILEIYDAIESYMLRYAETAEARGLSALADRLRRAACERPCDFASALQLLWIITLIDCAYITPNPTLTVGRLDQILYPLYRADIDSGRLTREDARELITDYYCKHNLIMGRGEHQVGDESNSTTFRRILCFDAPQYLMLAGTDENGKPSVNDLTLLFAECIRPSFKNPVIVVRYFKGMDTAYPALWQTLTQKALQSASMMFYNDDNMRKTYRRIGIPEEDIPRYTHFGCNWPSLGDNSSWMQLGPDAKDYGVLANEEERRDLVRPYMRMNTEAGWPQDLMLVLRAIAERSPNSFSIEEVYDGFFARMEDFIDRKLAYLSRQLAARRRRPSAVLTFGDCFYECSLQTAECISASAKYHFELQAFQMFATVCDSITVVDQLVLRDRRLTLSELLEAVERNFEGREEIHSLCRRVPKYGSDSPLSNEHAKRLSERACTLVIEKSRPYLEAEGLFLTPCMQSDTWHLKNGEAYGATPDGRLAHTPFSQNTRPSNGSCVNGLTGMLHAMLNLPSDGLLSGALNLDVQPSQFKGEEGARLFGTLLGTYLNHGGLHAQVTTVSADALIDAQRNPDAHRDLRVRVTGYSGIFVDICERLQNDIIERLK